LTINSLHKLTKKSFRKKLLLDKPQTYIRILNVICRLADSGLRYDKHRRLLDQQQGQSS